MEIKKREQRQSMHSWYIHNSVSTWNRIDSSMQQVFIVESNSDITFAALSRTL